MNSKEISPLDFALEIIKQVEDSCTILELLEWVAETYTEIGMNDNASEVIALAVSTLDKAITNNEPHCDVHHYERLIDRYAENGQFDSAVEVALKTEIPPGMIRVSSFEGAVEMAQKMKNGSIKFNHIAKSLANIANECITQGFLPKGMEILSQSVKFLEKEDIDKIFEDCRYFSKENTAYTAIVEGFVRAGQLKKAYEMVEFIQHRISRRLGQCNIDGELMQLLIIVKHYIESGHLKKGKEILIYVVKTVKSPDSHRGTNDMSNDLVERCLDLQMYKTALQVIHSIQRDDCKDRALLMVAAAYRKAGKSKQALSVLKKIEHSGAWLETTRNATFLAEEYAALGMTNKAVKILKKCMCKLMSITGDSGVFFEMIEIADTFSKTGNLKNTQETLLAILEMLQEPKRDPYPFDNYDLILEDIIISYIKIKMYGNALQVAHKIEERDNKDSAFDDIITALVEAGEFEKVLPIVELIQIDNQRWQLVWICTQLAKKDTNDVAVRSFLLEIKKYAFCKKLC